MKSFFYSIIILIFIYPVFSYIGYSLRDTSTEFGECIGASEPEEDGFYYEINKKNVILKFVFFDFLMIPKYTIVNDIYCPIGKK